MQKIALTAVLAALSTTVSAQNVTVYGIMDMGIQSYDGGTEKLTRSADNVLETSRLGFRGTEDLGSGLKALFQIEGRILPSNGQLGNNTTNQTFNREAWVGLVSGFGTARLGRTDVSNAQVMDALAGGDSGNLADFAVNGTDLETGKDLANVIRYISPAWKGFQAQIGHSNSDRNSTTDSQTKQTQYAVTYSQGKMKLGAGFGQVDGATSAAKRDFTSLAAAYDFGLFETGIAHITGDTSTTGDAKAKSTLASVRVPFGGGIKAHAIYAQADDASQAADNQGRGYTLALTKDFSKRTAVYGAYTKISNDANSAMEFSGISTATTGRDASAITVGLAHKF